MGDKRQITLVTVEIAIDAQCSRQEFDQLCIPGIRKACFWEGQKYAPNVWTKDFEVKEMEIIPPA